MIKILGVVVGSLLLFFSLWYVVQPDVAPVAVVVETKKPEVKAEVAAETQVVSEAQAAPAASAEGGPFEKGRKLYLANCIQCHNRDPNNKGSIGPEMVDAPLEVMTSKVMTGLYPEALPPGFVPKRKTKAMRKIPKLKDDIPDIHAWVQSVKKQK